MIYNNIRLAWNSIKSAKLRNLFTMLGVILGVASVVITVSLAEGVRSQVHKQADNYGKDLLIIQPGKKTTNNTFFSGATTSVLTGDDFATVQSTGGVKSAVPLSVINGVVSYDNNEASNITVIATNTQFPDVLNHKIAFGQFFNDNDDGRNFVVIGRQVAEGLFNENVPIGRSLTFRGQEFVVKGIFEDFKSTSLSGGIDFNNTVFLPYSTGQNLSQNKALIFQIFARPKDIKSTESVAGAIRGNLAKSRAGTEDFTVLTYEETTELTSGLTRSLTTMVAAIGVVTLVVGGVGIMNVMFVSVTERTHEIGVRKAVGASNQQIMSQFLVESMMLTLVGSIIGCLLAVAVGIVLFILTDLTPVITLPVVGVAVLAAVMTGVLFGVLPAIKASRKDPIDALRH